MVKNLGALNPKSVEAQIETRMNQNRKLIESLRAHEPTPPYAFSVLESARFNKYKVMEAHLSILDYEKRMVVVDTAEEAFGYTPLMYAAYYGNQDSIEILVASNATVQLIDKKGRTCLHYAVINDRQNSSRPIETIFLVAKASPHVFEEPKNFQKIQEDGAKNDQNLDEGFANMKQQMDALDILYTMKGQEQKFEQGNKGSFVNRQDHLGRTALHAAVAFSNKIATETLLYLGANPHIKDAYGQRPIEMCTEEGITSLLENKMHSVKPEQFKQEIDLDKMSSISKLQYKSSQ